MKYIKRHKGPWTLGEGCGVRMNQFINAREQEEGSEIRWNSVRSEKKDIRRKRIAFRSMDFAENFRMIKSFGDGEQREVREEINSGKGENS
ncbi:hypothetical protein TNCV_4695281 [Trichonephila clavipes]|nr:hypothetical protein TNCV_4695281 [Trichonephila clavipes]